MKLGNDHHGDEIVKVRHYVVCLVDVLGQSEELKGWRELPDPLNPPSEFIQSLKRSVGTIDGIRTMFQKVFHEFDSPFISQQLPALLPPEKATKYKQMMTCELSVKQFSDTFLFYAPLGLGNGEVSVQPVLRMLAACVIVIPSALKAKVALRGAIAVGTGLELSPIGFYGPALAEAYYYESNVAEYPRIVLSSEAGEFLRAKAGFSPDPEIEAMMQGMAAKCRRMICIDPDGQPMVDCLGGGWTEAMQGDPEFTPPPIKEVHAFVSGQAARFDQQRNAKLSTRYHRLLHYVESRLPIWGQTRE